MADQISSFSPFDPTADLERMERKIRQDEAEAAAWIEIEDTSIDQQFAELGMDDDIEAELEALKSGGAASLGAGK